MMVVVRLAVKNQLPSAFKILATDGNAKDILDGVVNQIIVEDAIAIGSTPLGDMNSAMRKSKTKIHVLQFYAPQSRVNV